jgi:hypothetical protein
VKRYGNLWKKGKSNSENFGKYRRKLRKDMKNMEEK